MEIRGHLHISLATLFFSKKQHAQCICTQDHSRLSGRTSVDSVDFSLKQVLPRLDAFSLPFCLRIPRASTLWKRRTPQGTLVFMKQRLDDLIFDT